MKPPFAIYSLPRTGCTYLLETIDAHYKQTLGASINLNEFFSRQAQREHFPQYLPVVKRGRIVLADRERPWQDGDDAWASEVGRRICLIRDASAPTVFKVFPHDVQGFPDIIACANERPVLAVRRRNGFLHFLSYAKARMTNRWSCDTPEPLVSPVEVPRDLFDEFVLHRENYERFYPNFRVTMTLWYEDLEQKPDILRDLFGVTNHITHIRRNERRIEWAANLDEIREWCGAIEATRTPVTAVRKRRPTN